MPKKTLLFIGSFFLLFVLKSAAQVSLQTGSATFSLPLYKWADDKSRLQSLVALSYSSGNGVRANDVASNVGQGWALMGGGVISRLQVGEPDDQQAFPGSGNGTSLDISRYPAGIMYATMPLSQGCPEALAQYPIYKSMNQIYTNHNVTQEDKQLDYFAFQFNGKVGEFVLDVVNKVGVPLGDTKMKITFTTDLTMISQGIRTTITSFTIQDVDGLVYTFSQHALTQVLHADFCESTLTKPEGQPSFASGHVYYQSAFVNSAISNPYVISNWYLTNVTDPLTGRYITFNYVIRNINAPAGEDVSFNSTGGYAIVSHKVSMTQSPELSSIVFPDGSVVTFNYGLPRVDYAGDYALSSVDITYQGRYISEYQLNTTYFLKDRYGTPVMAEQAATARLCLRSVTKLSVDRKAESLPYLFDYYLTSSTGNTDDYIPPPFFFAKDIWGYYNGSNSVPYDNTQPNSAISLSSTIYQLNWNQLAGLCFLLVNQGEPSLNPKTNYAQNGLLRQIVYPTGGALTYHYSQDTASINGGSQIPVGGVHVSQTSSTDGGNSNGCSNPIVTNYIYKTPAGTSSLWGLEQPVNERVINSEYHSETLKYHWTLSCAPFGCCYWKYEYPGILSALEMTNLSGFQSFMNTIGPVLGVVTIVADIADVVNLVLLGTPLCYVAVAVDIICGLVTTGITCLSGDNQRNSTYTSYYNADLNGANALPTQFSSVEIVEGSGSDGTTIQNFTSSADYPLLIGPGQNTDFSSKQRYAPWAYGLPKSVLTYGVSGNLVKQVVNTYSYGDQNCNTPPPGRPDSLVLLEPAAGYLAMATASRFPADSRVDNPADNRVASGPRAMPFYPVATPVAAFALGCAPKIWRNLHLKSVKCTVTQMSSQNNTDWDDPTKYNVTYSPATSSDIIVDTFDYYTGRLELASTIQTDYSSVTPANSVSKTTQFTYNSYYNYEVNAITTTESNGNTSYKYMTYISDFPSTGNSAIQAMLSHNMTSEPVSTMAAFSNSKPGLLNGTEYALNEKATQYGQVATGNIVPTQVLEQRWAQPTANVSMYYPDNPNNSNIYKIIQTNTYDGSGDLIGSKDEGGRTTTKVYDYNYKYAVATAVNADPVLDKVAYTSFETSTLGGWTLTGGAAAVPGTAITGSNYLPLGSSTLSAPLNIAKEYTLSFWATGAASVSAGTKVKSAPVKSGYTYYEYDVPAGTATVSVSGNVNIDELRLYPKTAVMRTTTFDPLLGKTSECDENNICRYYLYDNMGRLQFIQDEDHFMVKMYEYNNVSAAKQNGCPGTYTNNLVTEFFARSNCGAGYQGGEVAYSVPAAKYTSAISQQAADMQAETDLLTNGPALANSSGACNLIYYNTVQSQTVTIESCPEGSTGTVTYTVPANTYSSIVSQAAANQLAANDVAANAQAYANSPANQSSCAVSTSPDWETQSGAPTYCSNVNGVLPPHQFQLATDVNPNSPTYNQTQYMDMGPTSACPAGNYYNTALSTVFYKNNCTAGTGTGLPITYAVPAGEYSSTTSLAAANQLATNDANANGQNYANANGTCCNQTFTYSTTVTGSVVNNTYLSNGQVYFTWVFTYPSGGLTSFGLGTVNGSCMYPTGTRTIPFIQGSTTYNLVISPTGQVELVIVSGPVPTGSVGFNGSYSLTANAFYSAQESGTFTRNNCTSGQTGSSVTYTVAAYQYNSYTSQAAANQLAINQVNAGGQTYANTYGTCTTTCGFNWSSGLNAYSSTVSSSGTTGSFSLVFSPSGTFNSGTLGTITGSCAPSATRNFNVPDGATSGRSWNMTITSAGVVSVTLASGTAPTNAGAPVVLSGTYSL